MSKPSILATSLMFLAFSSVTAQVPDQVRQRRRAFFEDLLRVVVESQQDRNIVPERPGRPHGGPPELRPGYGRPNGPATVKMVNCRKHFRTWDDECGRLIVELRKEERRLPRLRPLLADAMRVLASITNIRAYAGRLPNIEPLIDPFCDLDADWRLLQHRLKQTRGLPKTCLTCIDRCNECNTQLCNIFEVQPQINRRELAQYCSEMSSHFQHLTQDVYYDMLSEPGGRKLVRDCQAIYAKINETVPLIQRADYDTIVEVFQDCTDSWQKLKVKLLECPHERVRRHCHKIETCGKHIRELLWLPIEIDYGYLATVCGRLQRDMDHIFESFTLKDLLATPQPGILLSCCRDFQKQCASFEKCISGKSPYEQMLAEHRLFMDRWNTLRPLLAASERPRIRRRLAECEEHVLVFGGVFGDGPIIDHYSMVQICAELDQLCLQLDRMVRQRSRNYGNRFRDEICDHAKKLRNCVHVLHEHAIANRRHESHARADLETAMVHWKKLRPLIKKFNELDRRKLNQLRGQIEPLLVKLQVVFLDVG